MSPWRTVSWIVLMSGVLMEASLIIQAVQSNRPQVYALLRSVLNESHWDSAPRTLHVLSLHSQLLPEADGRSAHLKMKIHPIANKFA